MSLQIQKPIKKGDLLISSLPFAYVLKSSLKNVNCDSCLRRRQNLQRCSTCISAYYCNRDCQKKSWSLHKLECSKLKKLKPNFPPDTARLLARVIFKLKDNEAKEESLADGTIRNFSHLMHHKENIKNDSNRLEHFTSLVVVLKQYLGEEMLTDTEELFTIYSKVLVNCFTITDKDLNGVGLGLYLGASILDHSCKPNAYASFVNGHIYVHSLCDMPKLDLNKVRISYIDVLNTSECRRKELQENYFFNCDCVMCSDKRIDKVANSIQCGNTDCDYPIYLSDSEETTIKCAKCGDSSLNILAVKEKYDNVTTKISVLLAMKENPNKFIKNCTNELLDEQENFLHKFNIFRVKLMDSAFECSVRTKAWEKAIGYGTKNLLGIKFYYGQNHPMVGSYLIKIGKTESHLFKLREALVHLEMAEPILKISHGENHPIVSDDLRSLLKLARQEVKMMQHNGYALMNKQANQNK